MSKKQSLDEQIEEKKKEWKEAHAEVQRLVTLRNEQAAEQGDSEEPVDQPPMQVVHAPSVPPSASVGDPS